MKKTTRKKTYVFYIVLFFLSLTLSAQNVKFGKPNASELKMKVFEADTTAHAVYLYDRGYFYGNTFDFQRHVRIKILTTAGTSFANFAVRAPAKSFIDGYTYNLENGQIVTTALQKSNIFPEEIVDGYKIYKIFFPHVKPGTVIDIKYTHRGLPSEWRFQDKVPIVYSELVLEPTQGIRFKKTAFGKEPIKPMSDIKWIAENVPALKEEPYMGHYTNYLTRFAFDIEGFYYSGFRPKDISTSWQNVGELLMQEPLFGGVLKDCPFLNEKADEIERSGKSKIEKINDAYRYIQDNIKWNKSKSLLATSVYRGNFKNDHSGNSSDVNLLLVALLQKAKIKTYPMVLSTRENGMMHPVSASINSLNYVMAYVEEPGLELVLDATSEYLVPGVVPPYCLNVYGWLISEPNGKLIEMASAKADVIKHFIKIDARDAGSFSADVTRTYEDYAFLDWISEYEKKGSSEAYENQLRSDHSAYEIDKLGIKSIDKAHLRSSENVNISLTDTQYFQDLGKSVFVNPFVLHDTSNPFKSEERKYPVDFIYPRTRSFIILFSVPENYEVKKIPESISFAAECGGAKFSYSTSQLNKTINIRCDLKIEKQFFTETDYHILRTFYTEVGRKMNESIELQKL
jgi:hypothetical protein